MAKGRPRKRQPKPGERVPLGLRVTSTLKDVLDRAAAESGRSQSQEAEFRLERSFQGDEFETRLIKEIFGSVEVFGIVRIIAAAMNETGQTAGMWSTHTLDGSLAWLDNPYAYDQAVQATTKILEAFRPDGDPSLPKLPVLKSTQIDASTGNVTTQEDDASDDGPMGQISMRDIYRYVGVGFANSKLSEAASGESRLMSPEAQERARALHAAIGRLAERLAKKGVQR